MQTYSGRAFVIANPTPDQICLEDIARSLSHQCRFAGHCLKYYSVAEHCVHVCNRVQELIGVTEVNEGQRLALSLALLHDAAEAYLLDMPRPLKYEEGMDFYRELHKKTLAVIWEKFDLPNKRDESVLFLDVIGKIRQADNELLATEAKQIMAPPPMAWDPLPDPLDFELPCWGPERAYGVFMKQAEALGLSNDA
jgi:hypothetical protein